MNFTDILRGVDGRVATIGFSRPDPLNALTSGLTGEGRRFSSAADLVAASLPPDAQGRPDLDYVLKKFYDPLIRKMRALPKPITAAINDDQPMAAGQALAGKLSVGPGIAIERIKRLIGVAATNDLAAQLDLECEMQRECGRSRDFTEDATGFAAELLQPTNAPIAG